MSFSLIMQLTKDVTAKHDNIIFTVIMVYKSNVCKNPPISYFNFKNCKKNPYLIVSRFFEFVFLTSMSRDP